MRWQQGVASRADRGFDATHMPDVSAIIVTRNTRDLALASAKSVFRYADGLDVEVIVVDNGSGDDTVAVLRDNCPGARCIRSERNLGFAKAVNLAARGSSAEFLLLLNSDAELQPGTLGVALEWMRRNPRCGVAGVQLLHPDGARQNSIANFPTLATELLNKSLLRRLAPKRYPGKETRHEVPIEVETVVGAFMLIRRKAWDELEGLDERFFFFFEETDFCFRARSAGWSTFHLPGASVVHGSGQSAKQVLPAARVEYWRSRYTYFEKNHGVAVSIVLRLGLGVRLVADWIAAMVANGILLGRSARWRSRLDVCSTLLRWHLCGCPAATGLPR
jgi:GT2 family glycosyltransferase